MKREAVSHTKMKRICRKLNLPLWQGVGLLESIWHLTAREAPRGDIGKLSDEDIALSIDYRGDETQMIEALVTTGWLERDPVERLIVHDWWEHADDAVQARLARTRQYFVRRNSPKLTKLNAVERTAAASFYRNGQNSALPEPLTGAFNQNQIIKPCASPDGNARVGQPPSIDDPPFVTTEPNALFPLELPPAAATSKGKAATPRGELSAEQKTWFNAWWAEYWLRKAKKPARKAFGRHVQTAERFAKVMAATRAQKPEMRNREASKRPHGATWLNDERWDDEIEAAKAAAPTEKIWSDYPEYPIRRPA